MTDEIVRKVIYEYIVNGEDYGLGSGEGRFGPRLPMPESVTNLDELIRYGASMLDSITEQVLVDKYYYPPPYKLDDEDDIIEDIFINNHIWGSIINKVIPSSATISGDCIPENTIDTYLTALMRPRFNTETILKCLRQANADMKNNGEDEDMGARWLRLVTEP